MALSRREFLTISSGVSLGLATPGLFQRLAFAAPKSDEAGGKETVLVVIELSGGNDGLNTVIPYDDPEYIKARPTLKVSANDVKKIKDGLGLHPLMGSMAELLESGNLAIVQGVGYPNPDRSHFSSMDIWHKATRDEKEAYGWLGRTLPQLKGSNNAMFIGSGESSLALFGTKGYAPTLTTLRDYQMRVSENGDNLPKRQMIEKFADTKPAANNDLLNLVRNSAQETYKSAQKLRDVAQNYNTPVEYPTTALAQRLKLVAQLLDAGVPDRVYYTSHGGFDTHSVQEQFHGNLLQELSDAVAAFYRDLKHHGHEKRVLLVTFSEFGRRINENGSRGTDHGSGSQMFIVGDNINAGAIGEHPDLTKPVDGDLAFHTDFRRVYATVLEQWLGLKSEPILYGKYEPIDLFKKS